MSKLRIILWPALILALVSGLFFAQTIWTRTQVSADTTPPIINVWYGSHQVFGSPGLPQKWVNILGNASDPESDISRLTYRLNEGQTVPLRLGPDKRRLLKPGDFNIELDQASLKVGNNTLQIDAVNKNDLTRTDTVTLEFRRDSWPLPYSINWSQVAQVQDVLQVVDGKWTWDASGIRPAEVGYDRVLALGSMDWTDYEVTVPATVHSIDTNSYNIPESGGAGFGVNLRWLGHTDNPVKCQWPAQPHCGWNPTGASDWYSFKKTGVDTLAIESEPPAGDTHITSRKFQFGHTYLFKARVESAPGGNLYRLKVWEPSVEPEPDGWTMERTSAPGDDINGNLRHGAFLLVAHNVDVTFGNIQVVAVPQPVSQKEFFLPLMAR